jgi:hypothetical protein
LYKSESVGPHLILAFNVAISSGDKLRKSFWHVRACVEKEQKIINEPFETQDLMVATKKTKIFWVVTPSNYKSCSKDSCYEIL